MGYESDGEGFSVVGPNGERHFESEPGEATQAWRRAQALAANARSRRN